jgi:hypothetical protein
MPPKQDGLVADIDAMFVRQIFNVSERKREPEVDHYRQANDLRTAVKVLKGAAFQHEKTLRKRPARLNPICSDKALDPPDIGKKLSQLVDHFSGGTPHRCFVIRSF